MLSFVRKHSGSWLIKTILWSVIVAFIGTTFFVYGMGGSSGSGSGVVAVVNGEEIYVNEYDKAFGNLVEVYRQQFRGQFSEQMIERLDLRNAALDQLILVKILEGVADDQNVKVSDEELVDKIKSIPAFQQDKKFDPKAYQNYLKFSRMSTRDFENDIRGGIKREKIENLIKSNVHIAPSEVEKTFRRESEKLKFSYITFAKDFFEDTSEPSDEEIQKHFKATIKDFQIPERIDVQYVRLTAGMLEDKIEIRDEDISEYYQDNEVKYHVKKQYKARHILFRSEPPMTLPDEKEEEVKKKTEEADKAVKAKADDVLKQIRDGGDFEALAKEHSDDKASGNNGGDLGVFSQGTMVTEFEQALDTLKPGEISEPVKSAFGFHIIKLEEVTEARVKPLDEVKEEITKALKTRKAKLRIGRILKKIRKASIEKKNLVAAAKEAGYEAATTGLISRKDHMVPAIGVVPEFFNLAFTLSDDELSELLKTPEASFLLKVIDRKPPEDPKLDDVKDQVVDKLKDKRSKTATKTKLKELIEQLKKSKDLEAMGKELKLEVQETPFFSLTDSIPGIGNIQEIKDNAFAVKPGEATQGETNFAYYLIKVLEFEKGAEPDDKELQGIYDRLKSVRANRVFKDWIDKVRETSDIQINRELMGAV